MSEELSKYNKKRNRTIHSVYLYFPVGYVTVNFGTLSNGKTLFIFELGARVCEY